MDTVYLGQNRRRITGIFNSSGKSGAIKSSQTKNGFADSNLVPIIQTIFAGLIGILAELDFIKYSNRYFDYQTQSRLLTRGLNE